MVRRSRWVVLGSVLVLGGIAALLAGAGGGAFARALATEAIRVWWYIDAVPDVVLWIVVVVAGLWWVVRPRRPAERQVAEGARATRTSVQGVDRLAGNIRAARRSTGAQRLVGERVGRLAVLLRSANEGVPLELAMSEVHEGRWPRDERLVRVLRPARFAGLRRHYLAELETALEVLESMAKGESSDPERTG